MFIIFAYSCKQQKQAVTALQYPSNKARVIYVYDPLCGWCFAFKNIINEFKKKHQHEVEFDILSGGMIVGSPKDSIGKLKSFFEASIPNLEEATGVKFGNAFKVDLVNEGTALFSSETPSLALSAYKKMNGKDPFLFASQIQHSIYSNGMAPENVSGYKMLAFEHGLDSAQFIAQLKDSSVYKSTWREFAITRGLGANGYPTVFYLDTNGKIRVLTDGYTSLEELEKAFAKVNEAKN